MLTLKIQYSKCAGGKNDDRNNEIWKKELINGLPGRKVPL